MRSSKSARRWFVSDHASRDCATLQASHRASFVVPAGQSLSIADLFERSLTTMDVLPALTHGIPRAVWWNGRRLCADVIASAARPDDQFRLCAVQEIAGRMCSLRSTHGALIARTHEGVFAVSRSPSRRSDLRWLRTPGSGDSHDYPECSRPPRRVFCQIRSSPLSQELHQARGARLLTSTDSVKEEQWVSMCP